MQRSAAGGVGVLVLCVALRAVAASPASEWVTIVDQGDAPPGAVGEITVACPDSSFAAGGGVDPFAMTVHSSAPLLNGQPLSSLASDGQFPAPDGWQARFRNASGADRSARAAVTCTSSLGLMMVVASATTFPNTSSPSLVEGS